MDQELRSFLEQKAYQLRVDVVRATTAAGSGHVTSCLSAADIVAVLFFHIMHFNVTNFKQANNDRFILSKGHAAPLLYAVLKQLGTITDEELLKLRTFDSPLEGHPTFRTPGAEVATGSLGCGLSIGLGMELTGKLDQQDFYIYALLGDSECAEGSIWEAAELASYYKANRLCAIIDLNGLGQTGETIDGNSSKRLEQKFKAFGWHVIVVDGHDVGEIAEACKQVKQIKTKPTVIIAKTHKGYGIDFCEDKNNYHGKAFKPEQLDEVLQNLKTRFRGAAVSLEIPWKQQSPPSPQAEQYIANADINIPFFSEPIATRKAYGMALAAVGKVNPHIVVLDGEVKNSTFTELFEKEQPQHFFQCFIAEQNMVGMGIGFAARKKIPFISTFGAFFTRAFDQIRMAAIGNNPIRLVGSHSGVSVGADGPSQMALEDIAMIRTINNSVIFYPCDATSTFKLINIMVTYNKGVSYLRTTREATKNLYSETNKFIIGGCNILLEKENSRAVVVAAGITVHEALKAAQLLEQESINISVIDLYCIKPIDKNTLVNAGLKSKKTIITVEDHYEAGGLGEAVTAAVSESGITVIRLAVKEIPRSGTPEQLRAWAKIDAHAIIKTIHGLIHEK